MAEIKKAKNQHQSGAEAEKTSQTKLTKKTAKKNIGPRSKAFADNIIRDSETAKKRGSKGGIASGEARRAKRDARETVQYMFGRLAKSENIRQNLKELGFEAAECNNLAAICGRLFSMAMNGNLEATRLLLILAGYDPEENRKERESVSADARREKELLAKIEALGNKIDDAKLAINLNDEDDNNDVVIYMPQIATEEECQMVETDNKAEAKPPNVHE